MGTSWKHYASKAPPNKHKIQIRPNHNTLIRISNHLKYENFQALHLFEIKNDLFLFVSQSMKHPVYLGNVYPGNVNIYNRYPGKDLRLSSTQRNDMITIS